MFKILSRSRGNVIGIRVDGLLTHADYQKVLPDMEELIRQYGAIRVLLEITGIPSATPRACMDDLEFDATHNKDIERVVVVGNRAMHEWMAKLTGLLFRDAEVQFFDSADGEKAWEWIEDGVKNVQPMGSSSQQA